MNVKKKEISSSPSSDVPALSDLLVYHDEAFVNVAFLAVLQRKPDAEGFKYYLRRLRNGVSKVEILKQLRYSKEGEARATHIAGLDQAIQKERWQKLPVFSAFVAWGQHASNAQKMRVIENQLLVLTDLCRQLKDARVEGSPPSANQLSGVPTTNAVSDEQRHFDSLWYLQENPDVAMSGVDAYLHYTAFGRHEGRPARYFDAGWYMQENPDVATSGADPYGHFIGHGKREGRPFRYFDAAWYLNGNPDVATNGIDPYLHYVKHGRSEGRQAQPKWLSGHAASTIVMNAEQRYEFAETAGEYTYIPPRRPHDLDRSIKAMERKPTFSIVVPVYNTPSDLLSKAVSSVQAQWYPHWELILADDASTSGQTKDDLKAVAADSRVVVLNLGRNHGIAGATNAALARATGEYVVLLDHDDELTPDCLFELALCINRGDPDYIYSDEDKIAPDGRFTEPHFKPGWSPDTMMSTMYTCHVSCIRRSLLEEIGGLRSEYDGCQDWDLVLRIAERTDRISHIPKVLYHWRIIPASIAADISAKSYVLEASRRVREDALQRRELVGVVEPLPGFAGYFQVNYSLRNKSLISIIIPTRDGGKILRRCIDSIRDKTRYRNFEIVILDNGSVERATLNYLDGLAKQDGIKVVRHDHPFNYSELNNIGVEKSRGDILCFLNDDTEVISADWLERMGGYAQLEHIGAVGAKLLYPGGLETQHAGILNLEDGPGHAFLRAAADAPGYYMRHQLEYNWIAVTGACLMVERKKYRSIEGFDESFPVAYNDIDLCFRLLNAGLYNVVCQSVRLLHHESISRGVDHMDEKKRKRLAAEKLRLYRKHPHFFQHDPFHSPNLHPNGVNFDIVS